MKAAAAILKAVPADVKRAKRAGCTAFKPGNRIDVGRLKSWLKAHPRRRVREAVPAAVVPQDRGAAAALGRLELMERDAFSRLQGAIGTDPENVAEARTWWLRCSEQLRRHDLAVEASRRDAGDLLPRSECERVIEGFVALVGIHVRAALEVACQRLAEASTAVEEMTITDPLATMAVESALAAMKSQPWKGAALPSWATAAVQRAIEGHC